MKMLEVIPAFAAALGIGVLFGTASAAFAHGAHDVRRSTASPAALSPAQEVGYLLHSSGAPRIISPPPTFAPHSGARTIDANLVVLEDDGTMIEGGVFVLDRLMAAFTTFAPDSFDLVNFFGASSFADTMFASASEYLVRNHVAGLGMGADLNRNAAIGIATSRLKSIQLLNDVRRFGPTPTANVPRFNVDFTGVELLGSEVVHMTGCYIRVSQSVGADILGRLNAHWSYFLSSEASVMEGCRWADNGDGTFTTIEVLNDISELDEYLLGLRPAAGVAPMFVLQNANPSPGALGDATFPYPGFTTTADRVDFTIADVVAQNGARNPDAAASPHHFTMAFALVVPQGTSAPPGDLAFLEQFRADWETFFAAETEGLGSMSTTIPRVPVVAAFDVDRIAGTAPLTVNFVARPTGTTAWLFWDFGDGSPLTSEIRPTHNYANPGTFIAKLTAMGSSGASTAVRTIRVGPFATLVDQDFEDGVEGWAPAAPNNATTGRWEFGEPEGTSVFGVFVQPENDHTTDGDDCWTTDKDKGDFPSHFDVDGGTTTLLSPNFDLSASVDPYVSYARWFSNSLGSFSDEDIMTIQASSSGGLSWTTLETVTRTDTKWNVRQFRLVDFVAPSATTRFRVQVSDLSGESLVEAAFDDFLILDTWAASGVEEAKGDATSSPLALAPNRPNPFSSTTLVRYELPATVTVSVSIFDLGGRLVRVLENGVRGAGRHEIAWDGREMGGRPAGVGVYWVRVRTPAGEVTRKIQLIR